jgi:hypothetical protein
MFQRHSWIPLIIGISLLRVRTKDNPFHCIPEGVFSAKSRQSWQKVKVSKLLILRWKTVIVPNSKTRQKIRFWIFSPLLYQLSYPAKLLKRNILHPI